jgi:hypothetical protein
MTEQSNTSSAVNDDFHPAWLFPTASAGTSRSPIDLLSLRYPFSQLGLMSPDEFAKQAGRRRSRGMQRLPTIDVQILEELHRHDVLVPLFRVDLTEGNPERVVNLSQSLTAKNAHTTFIGELYRGAAEGRVADPTIDGFQPWPTERRGNPWPSVGAGYLYSRHQLLGLDVAMPFLASLTPQLSGEQVVWHLTDAKGLDQPARDALNSWRSLAITLSALDTYYWPFITNKVYHDLDVWRSERLAFDPADMLIWLDLSAKQILSAESDLRLKGTFRDNLGDFYEIVRRAKPDAWETLSGDALSAIDFRLAADILDRFAADLHLEGRVSLEHTPLSQQGISARPHSLDATLTDLRLSPFPSLVIGVEGATEYKLVPRVLDLLEIGLDRNWISIIDFGGTDRDLSLLARYAGEPVLGRDLGSGVALERPMTRFLILTDAEHKYATAKDRNYQRKLLLDSLTQNVPPDLRGDYYSNKPESRIVEIRTWGRYPFEFAHFTDLQLARAMMGSAVVPYTHEQGRLVRAIHMQRTQDPSPNVDDVFWRGSGLSKTKLADALWPILEKKIRRAIDRKEPGPPVMRALVRAYEMAAAPYRASMMLQRKTPRRR